MGYERHNAIIVSAGYGVDGPESEHWIEVAHRRAVEVFADTCAHVTAPTESGMNNVRSFLIAPDGSKEGWQDSDDGDKARDVYVEWLRAQAYGDGSSPLAWVEVQYADDNRETRIVRDSDDLARAQA